MDRRPSPTTESVSILGESAAISPRTSTSVDTPSATVTPVRPQSQRPAIEIGTSTRTAPTAIGMSKRVRCITNSSGYVIENAAHATIHGDR